MIPDPSPPYEVDTSGALNARIRKMVECAKRLGVENEVDSSIAGIFWQLFRKPREWGDPIRDFRNAQFTEFHGRLGRFLCVYHVHARIPMVMVKTLIPQEGNPLFGQNFDE